MIDPGVLGAMEFDAVAVALLVASAVGAILFAAFFVGAGR